jgi:2-oxoglutarate dehydrogenase E2 component (dihydrolipoamide succinyltransferase)
MEFLVRTSIATPPEMPAPQLDDLRRREAVRARELAAEGYVVRLWRVPGEWANWGLWDATDEDELAQALDSLPLRPFLQVEILRLEHHPSDPASPHDALSNTALVPLGQVPVSVVVTRRAAIRGVNLEAISGSGPGGLIRLADVERAQPSLPPLEPEAAYVARIPPLEPLPELALPARSDAPHGREATSDIGPARARAQLTSAIEVEMSAVDDARVIADAERGQPIDERFPRVLFVATACVGALPAHPRLNASGNADALRQALDELTRKEGGGFRGDHELTGGSFAVIGTGDRGSLFDTPVVDHPRIAVLAMGASARRPVVVRTAERDESISIRSITWLTLAYDAQAVPGAEAASFLVSVKAALEDPDFARGITSATARGD